MPNTVLICTYQTGCAFCKNYQRTKENDAEADKNNSRASCTFENCFYFSRIENSYQELVSHSMLEHVDKLESLQKISSNFSWKAINRMSRVDPVFFPLVFELAAILFNIEEYSVSMTSFP